ncbi:MAG TPA: family 10 glycosylhydrolase [Verrucomicrobiae bacterium]|nr:family 10 glycosylhydrolase [Verrucomicrobiae bacterium]
MIARIKILSSLVWLMPAILFASESVYKPVAVMPPSPLREFRGAWVTVIASHQDWPSEPGLPVAQQKAELISLLDRAAQLHFNAVIFQVRPGSDALYASAIEPWSERLTGTMGKAPEPFYDPLAFAIQEAHKRGLELHAWFNPFRALHPLLKSPVARNHVTKTHPEWIRKYDTQYWLDPGEPAAREYVQRVVMDVVRRYDVDGVTFDDYFYPYPVKDASGRVLDFPDDASWQKYGLHSGLTRDEWRRRNVNQFVESVYQSIKAAKPWVEFGISPFGIWRPGNPASVKGLDAYANLYADSRLWLASGWVDYLAPQLYWSVDAPQQSFPALLNWWSSQNVKGRHLWPALNDANVGSTWKPGEIARQMQIIRQQPDRGEIHFHLRDVLDNTALAKIVRVEYAQPALVPASPWLSSSSPGKPKISATMTGANLTVRWQTAANELVTSWVLQYRGTNGSWMTQIWPANHSGCTFTKPQPEVISIRAVNRYGNISPPAAVEKMTPAPETGRKGG